MRRYFNRIALIVLLGRIRNELVGNVVTCAAFLGEMQLPEILQAG
jgi:hypothetical protein